jgi:hypothetical protein
MAWNRVKIEDRIDPAFQEWALVHKVLKTEFPIPYNTRSGDGSVGIATGYRLED